MYYSFFSEQKTVCNYEVLFVPLSLKKFTAYLDALEDASSVGEAEVVPVTASIDQTSGENAAEPSK